MDISMGKMLKRRMVAQKKTNSVLKQKLKQKWMKIIAIDKMTLATAKKVESMSNDWQAGNISQPRVKTEEGAVVPKFDFQEIENKKKKSVDPMTALKMHHTLVIQAYRQVLEVAAIISFMFAFVLKTTLWT